MCINTNNLVRARLKISATPKYKTLTSGKRKKLCVVEECEKGSIASADMCARHLHACECIIDECDQLSTKPSRMCDEHSQDYRKCTKCEEILPSNGFHHTTRKNIKKDGTETIRKGYHSVCKPCDLIIGRLSSKKRDKNRDQFMILLTNVTTIDRNNKCVCDLTLEYIKNLYLAQDKKCYYCSNILTLEKGDRTLSQISLDRVISSVNHIIGNCVVSCLFCNYAKSACSAEDFLNFLQILRDPSKIDSIKSNYAGIAGDPRICSTLRDKAVQRDKKLFKTLNVITSSEIRQLMIAQDYKCAITGIPFLNLKIPYFPFKMSLDRINNDDKNHSKDNCQLVCLAIQLGRNEKTIE